jgi:hypothetical protein
MPTRLSSGFVLVAKKKSDAGPVVIPGIGPIVISGIGDEGEGGGAKAARAPPEKRTVAATIATKANAKRSIRTAGFRKVPKHILWLVVYAAANLLARRRYC